MSIDIDINEMFSEKNQTIFFNKLLMDLENNTDIFKLTTECIVKFEMVKLFSSIKKIYGEYSVIYDEVELKKIYDFAKSDLIDDINEIIDEKQSANRTFINNTRNGNINKSFLKEYHKQIEEGETNFEATAKLGIQEHLEVTLYNRLIEIYPCVNEEMQQDILHIINVDCCNKVISRVIDEGKQRSRTLKNMSEETYQKYLELSKNSISMKKVQKTKNEAKVKIKQEN